MKVRFKKLSENAVVPNKAHPTDAGFDLTATRNYVIPANGRCLIDTGVAVDIPHGHYGMVVGRSGNTIKRGLVGQTGIIDCGYHGAIGIMAFNLSRGDLAIKVGERIGQLIIIPIPEIEFIETTELSDTDRGTGGYGSTGK